jgi:four helix bundle protein
VKKEMGQQKAVRFEKLTTMEKIKTHKELKVYALSFEAGMQIFNTTKSFPKEEMFSLTDQIRRSSRSVSGNIAEAFRKRRYPKSFIAKLSDSEGEAAETQVWLDYALACNYLDIESHDILFDKYDHIIAMLVNMINKPENWTL